MISANNCFCSAKLNSLNSSDFNFLGSIRYERNDDFLAISNNSRSCSVEVASTIASLKS